VGNLQYAANAEGLNWFCRDCWPQIHSALPESRLTVVGIPSRAVGNVAGMERTGVVPEVLPYYHRSRVAICPVRASAGRQFKVLEAFAAGIPVVATSQVAENLGAKDGEHLLVADSAADFARQVIGLCRNRRLAEGLRARALRFVRKNFSWQLPKTDLLALYRSLGPRPTRRKS
jgi:glycosyltransferase involved in cell wall biosynthesis